MAHLNDFIQSVLDGASEQAAKITEVKELTKVITDESKDIGNDYAKIGELYVEQHSDETDDTELGKLVAGVKASKKKIKDSKLKIAELCGLNFCPVCCEEVDDDALFCNNCGAKMPVKLMPGMVLCPHCQKAVREGIRFCTNCGHSMVEEPKPETKVCPNCGWETTDMSQMFCDGCGRRLEGGEEKEAEKAVEEAPTKKVCTNCGFTTVAAGVAFCDKCGRRMVEESEVNA